MLQQCRLATAPNRGEKWRHPLRGELVGDDGACMLGAAIPPTAEACSRHTVFLCVATFRACVSWLALIGVCHFINRADLRLWVCCYPRPFSYRAVNELTLSQGRGTSSENLGLRRRAWVYGAQENSLAGWLHNSARAKMTADAPRLRHGPREPHLATMLDSEASRGARCSACQDVVAGFPLRRAVSIIASCIGARSREHIAHVRQTPCRDNHAHRCLTVAFSLRVCGARSPPVSVHPPTPFPCRSQSGRQRSVSFPLRWGDLSTYSTSPRRRCFSAGGARSLVLGAAHVRPPCLVCSFRGPATAKAPSKGTRV